MTAVLEIPADDEARRPSSDPDLVAHAGPRGRIRTILLATDLTPVSEQATSQAVELAASVGARLLIVNVIDPAASPDDARRNRVDQLRADREPFLLDIVGRARGRLVEAAYLLWTGEAGHSIVAAAEAESADLIVVGTRGLDRAGRFLLGSVSDYVVYHSQCPVLVAR